MDLVVIIGHAFLLNFQLEKCLAVIHWLLLKPGPGPWTRTLEDLDPEKPGL